MSPRPSEIEKELIAKLEGQNFQNASDNCSNLQQKLIDQKRAEIDRRNKCEEQSRKKKILVSFGRLKVTENRYGAVHGCICKP